MQVWLLVAARMRAVPGRKTGVEDASIKPPSVASSLTAVSARAMLTALIKESGMSGSWRSWPRAGCASRSPS